MVLVGSLVLPVDFLSDSDDPGLASVSILKNNQKCLMTTSMPGDIWSTNKSTVIISLELNLFIYSRNTKQKNIDKDTCRFLKNKG